MKSHSIWRYLCQVWELLSSVCSPLQRSQSWGCWTLASETGRLRSLSAGWRRLRSQWRRSKKLSALPVSVFSDYVLQHVLLYWYDVYNIWFFSFPTVNDCSVIIPKWKEKKGKRCSSSLFSIWEMNILSLCNPMLSQLKEMCCFFITWT